MLRLTGMSYLFLCTCFLLSSPVHANQWQKINDPDSLRRIFNNTTLRGISLPQAEFELNKVHTEWYIEYCQDGTGLLTFMEQPIPRTWRIKGNDQACIKTDYGEKCYYFEQHIKYGLLYRGGLVGSRKMPWGFTLTLDKPELCNK